MKATWYKLIQTLVEKKVGGFCEKRVPLHVRDKLNLSHKIRGKSVVIYENRAPWRPEFKDWTSMPIAQMRYDETSGEWTLYCADRNTRWHEYSLCKPTKDLDVVLKKIDEDPTGIFFG